MAHGRWTLALLVMVLMVVGGVTLYGNPAVLAGQSPSHGTASTVPKTETSVAPSSRAPATGGQAAYSGSPNLHFFPPRHLSIGTCAAAGAGPVVPNCAYPVEAAPMGIGDFGVSGTTPYSYNTTQFLGVFAYKSLDIYNNSLSSDQRYFTVQLNVVLNFVNGGKNYSYWIQDVAVPEDTAQNDVAMSYEDNIWNFSSTSPGTLKGLSGNGTVSGTGSNSYYYDGATGTGSGDTLDAPNSFELLVVASQSSSTEPIVRFEYKDPTMSAFQTYDTVTFTDFKKVTSDRGFLVDGYTMNQLGLFEDAELTIGGPGGGSYTITQSTSQINMELYSWNGHNFESVPSAWNFGSDTAESTSNDQSIFSNDGSGTPLTSQLNGTTKDAIPGDAYTTAQVGTLSIVAPSVPTGQIQVASAVCYTAHALKCTGSYTGGYANLTLVPGTYTVWDNASTSYALGSCTITAASTLTVNVPGTCGTVSLTSVALSPTSASVAPSGTQPFTATPTCSSTCPSGVTYSWTLTNSLGTLNATAGSAVTFTAGSSTGTVTLFVNATLNAVVKQSSATITITSSPTGTLTSVAVSPTSATVGTTGSQAFSATPTCSATCPSGTTYSWKLTNSLGTLNASTGSGVTFTAGSTAGTVTLFVNATLNSVTKQGSATITVTSAPTLTSVAVSPPTATVGATSTQGFTATPTCSSTCPGGTTYSWTLTKTLGTLNTNTGSSVTFTAGSTAGTVTLFVNATLNAVVKQSSATITVTAAPTATVPSPSPSEVDVGGTVVFTSGATGGSGTGYVYTWTPSSTNLGCGTSTTSTVTCKPTAAASYTISVLVKDSTGASSATVTSAPYTVLSDPTTTVPSPSASSVEVGGTVTFSTSASGGTGSYTYLWSESAAGLGCVFTDTSASATCGPTAAGSYTVSVQVKDTNSGLSAEETSASYTVNSAPTVSTPTPSPAKVDVGVSVTFTTSASGGSGTYSSYTWTASSTALGCTLGTTNSIACVPTAAGTAYTVSVSVTDSDSGVSSTVSSASFTVVADPTVTLSAGPASVPVGGTTYLNASVDGGISSYSFVYTGLPAGCTSSNTNSLVCVPTKVDNYTVGVTVTDAQGKTTSGTAHLAVTTSSGTGSGSSSANPLTSNLSLLLLVIIIVVVAVVAIAVARSRREDRQPPPPYYYGAAPMAGAGSYGAAPPWQAPPPTSQPAPPPGETPAPPAEPPADASAKTAAPLGDGQTWTSSPDNP